MGDSNAQWRNCFATLDLNKSNMIREGLIHDAHTQQNRKMKIC